MEDAVSYKVRRFKFCVSYSTGRLFPNYLAAAYLDILLVLFHVEFPSTYNGAEEAEDDTEVQITAAVVDLSKDGDLEEVVVRDEEECSSYDSGGGSGEHAQSDMSTGQRPSQKSRSRSPCEVHTKSSKYYDA